MSIKLDPVAHKLELKPIFWYKLHLYWYANVKNISSVDLFDLVTGEKKILKFSHTPPFFKPKLTRNHYHKKIFLFSLKSIRV